MVDFSSNTIWPGICVCVCVNIFNCKFNFYNNVGLFRLSVSSWVNFDYFIWILKYTGIKLIHNNLIILLISSRMCSKITSPNPSFIILSCDLLILLILFLKTSFYFYWFSVLLFCLLFHCFLIWYVLFKFFFLLWV